MGFTFTTGTIIDGTEAVPATGLLIMELSGAVTVKWSGEATQCDGYQPEQRWRCAKSKTRPGSLKAVRLNGLTDFFWPCCKFCGEILLSPGEIELID
jgi:hypothetical protein